MPTVDPVDFTRLAEAVSDGDAVDWAAAGSQASPSDRRVLDALKVVSEIAGLHRTMPPSAGERPGRALRRRRLVPSHAARGHRPRRLRRRLPRLGSAARSRGRAQAHLRIRPARPGDDRGRRRPAAGQGPAPRRRHGVRRGPRRRLRRPLDGADPGRDVRGDHPAAGPVQRPRGGAVRGRGVRSAGRGALGRPAASRRQGAERDARSQRPRGADGLRHRPCPRAARRGRRRGSRRHAALHGAGAVLGRRGGDADRRLQRRRPAVPPRHRRLPAAGPLAGRSPAGPRAEPRQAAARRALRSALGLRQHRRARAVPRPRPSLRQRRRAGARAHRLPRHVGGAVHGIGARVRQPRDAGRRRRARAGRAGPGDVDRSPAPRLAARRDPGRRRRRRCGRGADVAAGAPARRADRAVHDHAARQRGLPQLLAGAGRIAGRLRRRGQAVDAAPRQRRGAPVRRLAGGARSVLVARQPLGRLLQAERAVGRRHRRRRIALPVPGVERDGRLVGRRRHDSLRRRLRPGHLPHPGHRRRARPHPPAGRARHRPALAVVRARHVGVHLLVAPRAGAAAHDHGRTPRRQRQRSACCSRATPTPRSPPIVCSSCATAGCSRSPSTAARCASPATPRPVAGRIGSNLYNREDYANFSAAGQGFTLLAYLGARQVDRELVLVDRQGRSTPLIGPGEFRDIAMSPAGDRLAYEQLDEVAGTRDIWTLDLARRQKTRITSDAGRRSGAGVVAATDAGSTSPRTAAAARPCTATPPTGRAATRS